MDKEQYFAHENLNQSKLKVLLSGGLWAFDKYQMNEDTDDDPQIYKDDSLVYGQYFEEKLSGVIPEDKYFIAPENFKFPSEMAASIAHTFVRNNGDITSEFDILSAMEGYYSSTKDKVKRVATFYSNCKDYVEYLRSSEGKLAITQDKIDLVDMHYDYICNNPKYVDMVIEPESKDVELRRSVRIFVENMKLELDLLRVDHKTKVIRTLDIKTCLNARKNFRSNFFKYRYDFQMGFYNKYTRIWAKKEYPGYDLEYECDFFVGSNASDQPPVVYTHYTPKGIHDYNYEGRKFFGVETALDIYKKSLEMTDPATRYQEINTVLIE